MNLYEDLALTEERKAKIRYLYLLRENTHLSPINYLKVLKERRLADENQRTLNRVEHCQVTVDYSIANELETILREAAWNDSIIEKWFKYGRHYDFEEFSKMMLDYSHEEKEEKRLRLRKIFK